VLDLLEEKCYHTVFKLFRGLLFAFFCNTTFWNVKINETRIWHVPAKHANRMDARAHTSTLVECAARFDASFSGVCRPKFTKLGTRAEQPCALILPRSGVRVRGTENMQNFDIFWPTV